MQQSPISDHKQHVALRIVPHPRTLRKAREQVKYMALDEVSPRRVRNYLHRWVILWVENSDTWQYQELLHWFIDVCRDKRATAIARDLYRHQVNLARLVFEPAA